MENTIEILKTEECHKKRQSLQNLIEQFSEQFNFPGLDESDYRKSLWESLCNILNDDEQEQLHILCLTIVRMLSREKKNLNELVSAGFLNLILRMGGLGPDNEFLACDDKLIEALKASCNILFNANISREICLKNGVLEAIFKRLKLYKSEKVPIDVQILDMKILFILTALQSDSRVKINDDLGGLPQLLEVLRVAQEEYQAAYTETNELKMKYAELMSEILKTLFNLTVQHDMDEDFCQNLVALLRDYILWESENKRDNIDLHSHIINLLINVPENHLEKLMVPWQSETAPDDSLYYQGNNMTAIHRILECFESKFDTDSTISKQLELLSPVLTLLRNCARSNRLMRRYLKQQVLPPLEDVHSRPEEEKTYRGHLCRLLTSPITVVRDLAADFLFILCKENVNRMIKYTGYGNAAGMFATRGLMLGGKDGNSADYSSDSEDSDTDEYNKYKHQINPVLGCYQPDRPKPMDNMTDEQKEFEAMKLVELMDSLTKTGIVKPCTVGKDGRPKPLEHVLELQEGLRAQKTNADEDSD